MHTAADRGEASKWDPLSKLTSRERLDCGANWNRGLALAATLAAYATLTAQDALIRSTVTSIPPSESLCLRSAVTLALCVAVGGRSLLARAVRASSPKLLMLRSLLGVAAWSCFFEANKHLTLANTTALVLCAPLLLAVLAPIVAQERTTARTWCALTTGMVGMLLTTSPSGVMVPLSTGFAIASAIFWAGALLISKRIAANESASVQLVYVNAGFIAAGCATGVAWTSPDLLGGGAILGAGLLGYVGQLLLVYALKHTTTLDVATLQYTSLIWALVFDYVFAGISPTQLQIYGALLVVLSGGLITVLGNNRRSAAGRSAALAQAGLVHLKQHT